MFHTRVSKPNPFARAKPDIANVQVYDRLLPVFAQASLYQSRLGDMLAELRRV